MLFLAEREGVMLVLQEWNGIHCEEALNSEDKSGKITYDRCDRRNLSA